MSPWWGPYAAAAAGAAAFVVVAVAVLGWLDRREERGAAVRAAELRQRQAGRVAELDKDATRPLTFPQGRWNRGDMP